MFYPTKKGWIWIYGARCTHRFGRKPCCSRWPWDWFIDPFNKMGSYPPWILPVSCISKCFTNKGNHAKQVWGIHSIEAESKSNIWKGFFTAATLLSGATTGYSNWSWLICCFYDWISPDSAQVKSELQPSLVTMFSLRPSQQLLFESLQELQQLRFQEALPWRRMNQNSKGTGRVP